MAPFISDLANSAAREHLLASLPPLIMVPYPSEQSLRFLAEVVTHLKMLQGLQDWRKDSKLLICFSSQEFPGGANWLPGALCNLLKLCSVPRSLPARGEITDSPVNKSFTLGGEASGREVLSCSKFLCSPLKKKENQVKFHFTCLKFVVISIGDRSPFAEGPCCC